MTDPKNDDLQLIYNYLEALNKSPRWRESPGGYTLEDWEDFQAALETFISNREE